LFITSARDLIQKLQGESIKDEVKTDMPKYSEGKLISSNKN